MEAAVVAVIPEFRASILDILDMGIITHYGYRVGAINFKILINECHPEIITGYYDPILRDFIDKKIKLFGQVNPEIDIRW
jgi:hypothetical protein